MGYHQHSDGLDCVSLISDSAAALQMRFQKDMPGKTGLAGDYVAAAFWPLVAVAAILMALFFPVWRIVSWDRVFNVQASQARAEVGPAVAIAFTIFVLSLPVSIISKIYGAYQEVSTANMWSAAGECLELCRPYCGNTLAWGTRSPCCSCIRRRYYS